MSIIEHVCAEAAKVRRKYMESEPERLAQAMNLLVRYEPMGTTPKACKGFYLYQSRRHVITVNSDLPAALQRIILAHEVAHAVLHREVVKLRAFHDFALYDNSSVYEYEANLFAAEYLLDDDEVMGKLSEDTFFVGVAQELRVPPELLDFKFRILKRKGWQVESPILANSDFLKRITE